MRKSINFIAFFLSFVFITSEFCPCYVSGKSMNDDVSTYTQSDMTLKHSISNTTVTNNTFCHIMQGIHVGTNYIYTSKTDDNGKYCIFTRTNIVSGDQTVMKCFDSEDDTSHLIYSTYVGYGSGITVRSVAEGGASKTYMYVSTGKAPYSLVRMNVVGDSLYLTGCFDTVTTSGKSIYFSSVKWAMTEGGYHYFLLKKKDEVYFAKIPLSANGGSVEAPEKITCYKLFTFDCKNALFAESDGTTKTISGIESWTHNGFEYDTVNKFLYVCLFNNGYNRQSAIITYNLSSVLENGLSESDSTAVIHPAKLSFLVTDSKEYFEIEGCGIRTGQGTAGDLKLYFSANSEGDKEGIYSFAYTRHDEEIENVAENSIIYTVNYDGNGSTSGSMKSTNHIGGISASLRKNAYVKDGYTFQGWYFKRESDQKWLYEDENGNLTWRTEGKTLSQEQKYLAKDSSEICDFTRINGDVITSYAVWSKSVTDKLLETYSPIDLGTDFYGRIFIGDRHINLLGKTLLAGEFNGGDYFRFVKQTDGSYTIFDMDKKNAFTVSDGYFVDGRNISMLESKSNNTQRFYIYYINKAFYLRPINSAKLLSVNVTDGGLELSGEQTGEAKNQFRVLKCSLDNYAQAEKDYSKDYGEKFAAYIKNPATGKFLTVNGNSVVFKAEDFSNNQKWRVRKSESGEYTFISMANGKALTVMNSSMGYGANVDLAISDETDSQKFYLLNSPEGQTLIKPVYTNYIVDMDTNNFDVHIYPYGTGKTQKNAQRFELICFDDPDGVIVLKEDSSYVDSSPYLLGCGENTPVSSFVSAFENEGLRVFDAFGNELSDSDVVPTGAKVCLMHEEAVLDSLTVIVKGDADGNGTISSTDYMRVKGMFSGKNTLDGAFLKASDVDENGEIGTTDYVRLRGHFLQMYNIYE